MTDTAHLEAMLDIDPDDWDTMLVLADAYEDAGDERLAAAYRWCARHRIPVWKSPCEEWWWVGYVDEHVTRWPWLHFVNKYDGKGRTRRAAMQALAAALAEVERSTDEVDD